MATLNVLVITYNHRDFIAQCLDSILSQKTQHSIRITIVEDCSTDGTQQIIADYVARYPEQITAHLNAKNLGRRWGIQPQIYNGFVKLQGDYIALIEGDDYWTDEYKVEIQIGTLEACPTAVTAAHGCVQKFQDDPTRSAQFGSKLLDRQRITFHRLIDMSAFFHISTLMFRNVHAKNRPKVFENIKSNWCCDIFFHILFAQYGEIIYIDRDMSVYRAHKGGSFSNMPTIKGKIFNINGLIRYNAWLGFRYTKDFSFSIYRVTREMLILSKMGRLPKLSATQKLWYGTIMFGFAFLYDFIDTYAHLDPAVIWHGEQIKEPYPRRTRILGYNKMFE